jgi:hypothetical protein
MISRMVPWEVTRLIMSYLMIVIPFREYIDDSFDSKGFLFHDGKGGHWKTEHQSYPLCRSKVKLHFCYKIGSLEIVIGIELKMTNDL